MINKAFPYRKDLLRGAVAAVLGTAVYAPVTWAQDEQEVTDLEEVVVTGSRIVRRDMEVNSPLLTIDRQLFEDNAFISVEEALNDLPQFMAGGVGMNAGAVTSLQAANGLEGGMGSGDAFNSSVLPNNAQAIGIIVPGAANANLRGLGANRSLTLIDGHRAMPLNASMVVDLNTIPSIAIGGMEVITGGASAVYGADALAGVTNIKFRDNYEGMQIRVRGGTNEVGDGEEHQVGVLVGANFADNRGNVLIGMEYSKRREALWAERDHFREVMESPYSDSGDYITFWGWDPYYTSAGDPAGVTSPVQGYWHGGAPSTAAILEVFGDRTCADDTGLLNCVATPGNTPRGGGWYFNPDGTLYTRSSQVGAGSSAVYYGPQRFNQAAEGTAENPFETTCTFTTLGVSADPNFSGEACNPTVNRVDWGRWLSGPRDAYNLFGRATFDITDTLEAYSNFHFASSSTYTRREPNPITGGFYVAIPFDSQQNGEQVYLPSLNQATGSTISDFLPGGTRGTTCAPTGGCTISQAFPVPGELRTLLESRPEPAPYGASSPFAGLSQCNVYTQLPAGTQGAGVMTNPANGALYSIEMDPDTGLPVNKCGADSGWQLNWQPYWMPPRGTENTAQLYQVAFGLRGELGISDWTWDLYTSHGSSVTQTAYIGFVSINTYQRILSAPNYGRGYSEVGPSSKYLKCTSGFSPFEPNLTPSDDCLEAIALNSIDRNNMQQRIFEGSAQGHVLDLPAGEVRGAVGATYRWNSYSFTPDAVLDRNYLTDFSGGAFGSGKVSEDVSVKEVYGELLVPVVRDLPFVRSLELELGARYSEYSTGQEVSTYKALGSWEPMEWLRLRGGYNRAERAPNMSELYSTPNGSAQFGSFPNDPCHNDPNDVNAFPGPTPGSTLNNTDTTDPAIRAQLQALCSAQINAWGGNNASAFHADPDNFEPPGGSALVVGNPNLKNEQGDTWTFGLAFSSPFEHELLSGINGTIDWYKAKVTDPIAVLATSSIINSCYNINGLNPSYLLDDPTGYCELIERDPVDGGIERVFIAFENEGELEISGVDVALRWSAPMADLGLESLPGVFSISSNMNFLIDQVQRFSGSADQLADYAGYTGAAKFRANTGFTYSWDRHRVTLMWNYRDSTETPITWAANANAEGTTGPEIKSHPFLAGYKAVNLFNLTAGTRIGPLNASLTISNLFDKKPRPGGYDIRDPRNGFGTFSPFDDLVGRRYSFNLSAEF